MEDYSQIRSRPELLQPADLEVVDDIVTDLVEQEPSVRDFMLAIAAATVWITVALIRRESIASSFHEGCGGLHTPALVFEESISAPAIPRRLTDQMELMAC